MSPIIGMDMWNEVQADELQPPVYKTRPERPRKVRIREYGEDWARRRRIGLSYKCAKWMNFVTMQCHTRTPLKVQFLSKER